MGIEKVKRVSDPTRLRKGDVLVVPKGCALTQLTLKTLSKIGLHNGDTCRSENRSSKVSKMFLDSSNGTMMFCIEPTNETDTPSPEASRRASLLSNSDGFDNTPKTLCARLYPMNFGFKEQFMSSHDKEYAYTQFAKSDVIDILFGCKIPTSVVAKESYRSDSAVDKRDRVWKGFCEALIDHNQAVNVPTFNSWYSRDKMEADSIAKGYCSEDAVKSLMVDPFIGCSGEGSFYVEQDFVKNACERGCYVVRFSENGVSKATAGFIARKIAESVLYNIRMRIAQLEKVAASANEGILVFKKRAEDFEKATRGLMEIDKSGITAAVKAVKEAK